MYKKYVKRIYPQVRARECFTDTLKFEVRKMLEKEIEYRLRTKVRQAGGIALKFTSPGTKGVPDRVVLAPNGVVIFVELKAPNKKPRPEQVRMIDKFRKLGCDVRVIDSYQGVDDFVKEVFV